MTKEELLTALRAAPGPSRELDAEIALAFGIVRERNGNVFYGHAKHSEVVLELTCPEDQRYELDYFTSSLDAAAAFRERMLPGWIYASGFDISKPERTKYYWAFIRDEREGRVFSFHCATECLSIVAAVVAGVIAKEAK
jgi:hypothetical protein